MLVVDFGVVDEAVFEDGTAVVAAVPVLVGVFVAVVVEMAVVALESVGVAAVVFLGGDRFRFFFFLVFVDGVAVALANEVPLLLAFALVVLLVASPPSTSPISI